MTPFFFTDQAFLKTLLNAALSGVDVRMVLPSLSYKITIDLMRLPYAKMLDAGIKIYEYKGYLHSKVTIIDNDLMTVGTANLDYNSFYWANQTTLLIYDSHLVKQAEKEIFANDFRHSDLLKSDPLNKSSRFYL
ncbi:MAG: phospholipase D-like domain-containing protein [Mollicutes bacterium]|nr:MAG: phospholipase D-like domain-containing protein [Mollicutes bacterium]